MPKLSTFMYCEEVVKNEQNNNQIMLRAPLTVFRPAFVPGMFSFSLVLGISGIDPTSKEYKLQLKFFNPTLSDPIVDTGVIPIVHDPNQPKPTNDLPEEFQGILVNLDFRNVVLKHEGEYFTEVILDGELLNRVPVYVKGAEQT